MINYRTLLVSRADNRAQEDVPRALSPTQFKNRQSLEAWRERWARHHALHAAVHGRSDCAQSGYVQNAGLPI
jgi:hypothetical protein